MDSIKKSIVSGYKRGVCTADGGWIPYEKRGMAGKGSHYIGRIVNKEQYENNYIKIFGHK
jgi:hypothetical protein